MSMWDPGGKIAADAENDWGRKRIQELEGQLKAAHGRIEELENHLRAAQEALTDLRYVFRKVAPDYKLDTLGLEITRALETKP